jgi:hypothetical protein
MYFLSLCRHFSTLESLFFTMLSYTSIFITQTFCILYDTFRTLLLLTADQHFNLCTIDSLRDSYESSPAHVKELVPRSSTGPKLNGTTIPVGPDAFGSVKPPSQPVTK